MSWPSSFGVAVLTSIVGLIASAVAASLAASWYRIPSFEAESAAFVVSLAILGLVLGFVIGLVASRGVAGGANPGFLKALGLAQGVLLGLVLVVGVTARLFADVPPTLDGEQLMLAVEVRWPATHTTSPVMLAGEPSLVLGSITRMSHTQRASSRGPLWTSDARLIDGRWVAPGAVDIFTTRGRLSLEVVLDSATNVGFMLPLSGSPERKDLQWTDWYPHARSGAPPLADGFQYRYRVQKRSEPVRTETIGAFDVQTIAYYFFNETVDGTTALATNGRFAIRHRSKPVVVDAKRAESKATTDSVEKADGVAVIGGPQPALLAHFVDDDGQGPCYMLTSDSGQQLRSVYVPNCSYANGSVLTTDATAFREGTRAVARGRVNRQTFANPGLYTVGGSVVDTRRLAVYSYTYPESFSIFPSTPPLGISPDERSFVRIGSDSNAGDHAWLGVADFVGNRSYLVPIDEARMRYATPDAIDPSWLMHHFTWQKGSGGVDSLVERKGFVPIPYHSRLSEATSYWFQPARQPLRDAILDLLVREFNGQRVPVESYAYEYPVKIDGQTINVAFGESAHYIAVSIPRGVTDTKLLETVVKRIDAVLATGKFDDMFGK